MNRGGGAVSPRATSKPTGLFPGRSGASATCSPRNALAPRPHQGASVVRASYACSDRIDHDMKRATCIALFFLCVAPQPAVSQGGGRGGANTLNSIPNLTAAQRDALAHTNEELSPRAGAVTAARNALAAATFAEPPNSAAIRIMAGALREAELDFARAHADALAPIQASAARLSPDQIAAWSRVAGAPQRGGRGGRGAAIYLTQGQAAALAEMSAELEPLSQAAAAARTDLPAAPASEMPAKADALRAAELKLAAARAASFARLQASPARLSPDYVASLTASGGAIGGGRGGNGLGFTLPEPIDFNDHEGYRPLFDGVSLKGWDGNPNSGAWKTAPSSANPRRAESQRKQLHRLPRRGGQGLHSEIRNQGRGHRRQRLPVPQ